MQTAPSQLTNNVSDDPHQFMLNRLTFEYNERKRLRETVTELKARKKALTEVNAANRHFLDSLAIHLSHLANATIPIQQQISLPHIQKVKQNNAAHHLPTPLYTLFFKASAYRDAFGKEIDVHIVGVSTMANEWLKTSPFLIESSPLAPRRDTVLDSNEKSVNNKTEFYIPHPLAVVIELFWDTSHDDNKSVQDKEIIDSSSLNNRAKKAKSLLLRFEYLSCPNFVTVAIQNPTTASTPIAAPTITTTTEVTTGSSNDNNVVLDKSLLVNLFQNDSGLETPNPSNHFLVETGHFGLDWSQLGSSRPYKWAQWLAGLDFLLSSTSGPVGIRESYNIRTVMGLIKTRIKARIALCEILHSLGKRIIPDVNECTASSLKSKPILESWTEITLTEFHFIVNSDEKDNQVEEGEVLTPTEIIPKHPLVFKTQASTTSTTLPNDNFAGNHYYRAVLEFPFASGIQRVQALIELSPEYPTQKPILKLKLIYHADTKLVTHLKALETELNTIDVPPQLCEKVLLIQLHRLQTALAELTSLLALN